MFFEDLLPHNRWLRKSKTYSRRSVVTPRFSQRRVIFSSHEEWILNRRKEGSAIHCFHTSEYWTPGTLSQLSLAACSWSQFAFSQSLELLLYFLSPTTIFSATLLLLLLFLQSHHLHLQQSVSLPQNQLPRSEELILLKNVFSLASSKRSAILNLSFYELTLQRQQSSPLYQSISIHHLCALHQYLP